LNAYKTEGGTEIAFANKEDDLSVPIGHPGSQIHLPKLRNHYHNQLTQTQEGTLPIPPSSATSQVVVMMLVLMSWATAETGAHESNGECSRKL
jgi:hypothetical protein